MTEAPMGRAPNEHQHRMNVIREFVEAKHRELAGSVQQYSAVFTKLLNEMSAEVAVLRKLEAEIKQEHLHNYSVAIQATFQELELLRQTFAGAAADESNQSN